MVDLHALIAKQRDVLAKTKKASVDVVLAGVLVAVEVTKLHPDQWQALVVDHPPRATAAGDAVVGYDEHGLPRDYPAEKISVGGEPVDQETWQEIYAVLEGVHRNNVGNLIWGLNVYQVLQELKTLGKAAAGRRSSSPANRESRRAASKAGSRAK